MRLGSRPQPARRIRQERLERQLGRAEERGVHSERRRDDADEATGRREGAPVELARDGAGDERVDPAEEAAEDDESWIEDVDEAGQAHAEPVADIVERAERLGRTRLGLVQDRRHLEPAATRRMAGPLEQGALADLGLPAAHRSAAAGGAVRVDRDVADLSAVAGDTREGLAAEDEATADADLAVDEQDVLGADGRASPDLGQGAQVGVVGDGDRAAVSSASARRSSSGTSRQPRFGAIDTNPSLRRTTPTMATPTPMYGSLDGRRARISAASSARSVTISSTEEWPRGRSTLDEIEDLAAQPDLGGGKRIDGDLKGQHDRALGIHPDEGGRATGRAHGRRAFLGHETGLDELADQAPDGAPGQAGQADELGPGEGATNVQLTDDRA